MSAIETISLAPGQKAYFASDFHLGTPTPEQSRVREQSVVNWLDTIRSDAAVIFLVGDVFDFWFEYKRSIPKGFIRLQGKLAELTDAGLRIVLFTGNHDMWMNDYFTQEMGIPVYREPRRYDIGNKQFLIGHGDGLGPGDFVYKRLKTLFESNLARQLFRWVHPDVGIGLAHAWSRKSRISNQKKGEEQFKGEDREWLWQYCREVEATTHHDFYVFGHRHLPLDLAVTDQSRYVNLGEWVYAKTYAVFDGERLKLETWK
ncbi:UDP-2,3-diacylglucosamine diphosphatase [Spirosoma sp. BT702]|uniref:UDP-2,3-diacylglucosamine diphosphatase n=1 Tax=Spirosoma profusum TaxID=2771354 RepID=A0A926Y0E1_9BACT|nr:UDP-2,3-diacylglucosamine diphosphatase [Spirosoma profusum]MBD2704288.1 UDP-2,3-diacylglucosamine diphosphatase [Spirosoma profusum]